jgi:hypothetical protein
MKNGWPEQKKKKAYSSEWQPVLGVAWRDLNAARATKTELLEIR